MTSETPHPPDSIPTHRYDRAEMHTLQNQVLHGIYLGLYALVKYMAFPFANYLRFGVLRLFMHQVSSNYISDGVMIWFPWRVSIGRKCSLNQGVIIDGFGGVDIGDGVRIAAYVYINTSDHDFADLETPISQQGFVVGKVIIEDDVWIGTHTTINKGCRIGRGSVIGSGSVVTHDIPPYSIAYGVPCRVAKKRGE